MRLFIAEKPSVARAIADSLGVASRSDGYITCKDGTIVTNCFGHLLERAEPDEYLPDSVPLNPKSGKKMWRLEDLPIIPEKWIKKVSKDKSKQVKIIKSLLKDATEVVNAGDPDREGQLLVDEVIEYCGYKGKVTRYWQSAMDAVSVKRALNAIVPNSKYYNWGVAAEGRGIADWLVGMNFSRQLTVKYHSGLISVGRVQSPVLKIVADRDLAIENFKSKTFYNLDANFSCNGFAYRGRLEIPEDLLDPEGELTDKTKADNLLSALKGKNGIIDSFKKEAKKTQPKLLYTLADLQVDCSRLFNYSAKKTLDIAQKLYEEFKLTTYPRSSCEYLPAAQESDVVTILGYLKVLPEYAKFIDSATNIKGNKVFNDKKVNESAHTGIAPTPKAITREEIDKLPEDCAKVYNLIVKRYIACFMPPYEYNEFTIISKVENYSFKSILKEPVKLGFKALDKDEQKDEDETSSKVPALNKGDVTEIKSIDVAEGQTTPPKYFTEGTLIQAMRNIAKFIDDKDEKKLLKETDGLGTEATRAAILEVLKNHGYLEIGKAGKIKGKIVSTAKGREILKVIPKKIQSPALTAHTEEQLRALENGSMKLSDFTKEKEKEIRQTMSEIEKDQTRVNPNEKQTNYEKCPVCGSRLWRNESKTKKGIFYWHCGNKECNLFLDDVKGKPVRRIEIKCPKCNSPLRRFESKFQKGVYTFVCVNQDCRARYADKKGKLGEEILPRDTSKDLNCPSCGKEHSVRKFESKKKPGKFFYRCSACTTFFACNEDNTIGAPFITKK